MHQKVRAHVHPRRAGRPRAWAHVCEVRVEDVLLAMLCVMLEGCARCSIEICRQLLLGSMHAPCCCHTRGRLHLEIVLFGDGSNVLPSHVCFVLTTQSHRCCRVGRRLWCSRRATAPAATAYPSARRQGHCWPRAGSLCCSVHARTIANTAETYLSCCACCCPRPACCAGLGACFACFAAVAPGQAPCRSSSRPGPTLPSSTYSSCRSAP